MSEVDSLEGTCDMPFLYSWDAPGVCLGAMVFVLDLDYMGAGMGKLIASKRGLPTIYVWDRSAILELSKRLRLEDDLNFMFWLDEGSGGLWEPWSYGHCNAHVVVGRFCWMICDLLDHDEDISEGF
jgi:hypothetical protein